MGVLYKLTSPSGKSYIGISSKDLDARWRKHVEHAMGKRTAGALYAALRKYGPDSFVREVLAEEEDWNLLCNMERDAIKAHGTFAPAGYNVTTGGEGICGPRDARVRAIISVAQKKRFARPGERAKALAALEKAAAVQRAKRAQLPADYVPPWKIRQRKKRAAEKLPPGEHARRTRDAMARPDISEKVLRCAKDRAASPEWRRRISASKRGAKLGPQAEAHRRAISEARRREWADPVIGARRRMALVASHASRDGHGWYDL